MKEIILVLILYLSDALKFRIDFLHLALCQWISDHYHNHQHGNGCRYPTHSKLHTKYCIRRLSGSIRYQTKGCEQPQHSTTGDSTTKLLSHGAGREDKTR